MAPDAGGAASAAVLSMTAPLDAYLAAIATMRRSFLFFGGPTIAAARAAHSAASTALVSFSCRGRFAARSNSAAAATQSVQRQLSSLRFFIFMLNSSTGLSFLQDEHVCTFSFFAASKRAAHSGVAFAVSPFLTRARLGSCCAATFLRLGGGARPAAAADAVSGAAAGARAAAAAVAALARAGAAALLFCCSASARRSARF